MCATYKSNGSKTSYSHPSNSNKENTNSSKKVMWKKNGNENYTAELTNLLGKMISQAQKSNPMSDESDHQKHKQ